MSFKKDIKSDIESLQIEYRDLSELVYKLTLKVNNLFARDQHGFERPKVDLLAERIEKLEKTEVDLSEKTER